ncbi:hypothetical protein VUR80DRAFT_8433 [Thermomyces stellatus]
MQMCPHRDQKSGVAGVLFHCSPDLLPRPASPENPQVKSRVVHPTVEDPPTWSSESRRAPLLARPGSPNAGRLPKADDFRSVSVVIGASYEASAGTMFLLHSFRSRSDGTCCTVPTLGPSSRHYSPSAFLFALSLPIVAVCGIRQDSHRPWGLGRDWWVRPALWGISWRWRLYFADYSFPPLRDLRCCVGIGCIVGVSPSWSAFAKSAGLFGPGHLLALFVFEGAARLVFATARHGHPLRCPGLALSPASIHTPCSIHTYPYIYICTRCSAQRRIMYTISAKRDGAGTIGTGPNTTIRIPLCPLSLMKPPRR